jgi:hypothetical protein
MLIFRALSAALTCMFLSSPTLAAQVFASPATIADSAHSFRCSDSASRTQMTIVDTTLAGVPATLRVPESVSRPPVVLWHGFGPPDSERALMEALPLDDVPAIKVYLGLPLFGARMPAEGMREVVRRQNEDMATLVFQPTSMRVLALTADVVGYNCCTIGVCTSLRVVPCKNRLNRPSSSCYLAASGIRANLRRRFKTQSTASTRGTSSS